MFTDLPLDNFCTSGISKTKLTKCTVVSFDQDTLNTFKSTMQSLRKFHLRFLYSDELGWVEKGGAIISLLQSVIPQVNS